MRAAPTIVIPAAGASSRMRGGDKLLEHVDGRPLLRLVAERALATGFPVRVALPSADHPRARALAGLNVEIVVVENWADGMSASLKAAVAQIETDVMIVLADMPNITPQLMTALAEARNSDASALIWRTQTPNGKAGHPALFDASLLPEFAALSGDQGAAPVIKTHAAALCLMPIADDNSQLDLDTPEAWDMFRQTTGR